MGAGGLGRRPLGGEFHPCNFPHAADGACVCTGLEWPGCGACVAGRRRWQSTGTLHISSQHCCYCAACTQPDNARTIAVKLSKYAKDAPLALPTAAAPRKVVSAGPHRSSPQALKPAGERRRVSSQQQAGGPSSSRVGPELLSCAHQGWLQQPHRPAAAAVVCVLCAAVCLSYSDHATQACVPT